MAKTPRKMEIERIASMLWDMHQRMGALEASMFDFAVRQRAMEELMTMRRLMNPAEFNATCERMIEEIKEMQAHAAQTPDGRQPAPDGARREPSSDAVVATAPRVAGDQDAHPVSV